MKKILILSGLLSLSLSTAMAAEKERDEKAAHAALKVSLTQYVNQGGLQLVNNMQREVFGRVQYEISEGTNPRAALNTILSKKKTTETRKPIFDFLVGHTASSGGQLTLEMSYEEYFAGLSFDFVREMQEKALGSVEYTDHAPGMTPYTSAFAVVSFRPLHQQKFFDFIDTRARAEGVTLVFSQEEPLLRARDEARGRCLLEEMNLGEKVGSESMLLTDGKVRTFLCVGPAVCPVTWTPEFGDAKPDLSKSRKLPTRSGRLESGAYKMVVVIDGVRYAQEITIPKTQAGADSKDDKVKGSA